MMWSLQLELCINQSFWDSMSICSSISNKYRRIFWNHRNVSTSTEVENPVVKGLLILTWSYRSSPSCFNYRIICLLIILFDIERLLLHKSKARNRMTPIAKINEKCSLLFELWELFDGCTTKWKKNNTDDRLFESTKNISYSIQCL